MLKQLLQKQVRWYTCREILKLRKTREGGGFLRKLKVSVLGGQSFFVNNYVANMDGCSMGLTGGPIGDIVKMEVKPEDGLIVQSGAYIASTSDVVLDTQWQGFTKGLFG
jgi:uncharacterized protein (AIM24 family)